MIMSRNSRPKSSGAACTVPGTSRRAPSVRTSTPALSRSSISTAPWRSWKRRSISRHSAAPQMPVRRVLAFSTTRRAFARVGLAIGIDVADASRWAKTGTRASRWTRPTSPLPPRGTITSICSTARSMALTISRSRVGSNWIAASGRPACRSPSTMQAWIAVEEWKLSDPPRRITALPALRHSAPASAVTLGRLS